MEAKQFLNNQIVAVCASGPSLNAHDVKLLDDNNIKIISVNNSWKLCRNAAVIYAADYNWWRLNAELIDIDAERWTCCNVGTKYKDVNYHDISPAKNFNSGMRAIQFALECKASLILLLGFDCSIENGYHWHGKHVKLSNPTKDICKRWETQFNNLASRHDISKVINCSRFTALTCFKKMKLEVVLNGFSVCSKNA